MQKLLQKLWAPFLHIIKNAWLSFCSAFSVSFHTANQTQSCKQWAGYKNMRSIKILSNAALCSSSLVCTGLWCFTAQFQEGLHSSLGEVFEAIQQIWRLAMPKCASSVSDHCGQYQQDNKQSKVIKQNRGCNRGAPYCWCRVDVPIEKKAKSVQSPDVCPFCLAFKGC